MYQDLEGKTALVSGAGKRKGIGFAIAEKLAACKADIVIADLGRDVQDPDGVAPGSRSEMEECAASLNERFGVRTLLVDLDVTDGDSVEAMAAKVKEAFGRVDVLCNNAGATFGVPNAIHTYDETAWLKTIDVCLHGVYRVSKAVLPLMMGRPGSIINTSSRASKTPPIFNGAYAVSKAGANMLTKVMARELAGSGIRVNAVCPGIIATDLHEWRLGLEARFLGGTTDDREQDLCTTIPLGRTGNPAEVAALVAFLASAESSYLTGQAINVTGGQLMEL